MPCESMISTWKIVWVSILANIVFGLFMLLIFGAAAYKMLGRDRLKEILDKVAAENPPQRR